MEFSCWPVGRKDGKEKRQQRDGALVQLGRRIAELSHITSLNLSKIGHSEQMGTVMWRLLAEIPMGKKPCGSQSRDRSHVPHFSRPVLVDVCRSSITTEEEEKIAGRTDERTNNCNRRNRISLAIPFKHCTTQPNCLTGNRSELGSICSLPSLHAHTKCSKKTFQREYSLITRCSEGDNSEPTMACLPLLKLPPTPGTMK